MFHQAVADRVGLNATDLKCLDLAREAGGPLTAGRLAEVTGLTSGAITGVIDHLERAGLARRVRDPQDRRKVLVEPILEPMAALLPIYQELGREMAEVCMGYDAEELKVVYRFLEETIGVMKRQTERLRDDLVAAGQPQAAGD
jgi:DNA-binding MarR family transcriptional regulator